MKIADILKNKKTLSFEIFPPKKDSTDIDSIYQTIDALADLKPDFISVTYGAMGSTTKKTAMIASYIKNNANTEALAHLTAMTTDKEDVIKICNELKEANIENIMSLRGDRPSGYDLDPKFSYASELNKFIIENYNDDFCLGGACYPEVHFECDTLKNDLLNLKKKQESGAKFFVTQIFFDNSYFYRFLREARKMGITIPIIPGIMPIINTKQVKRMIESCGTAVPLNLKTILEEFSENKNAMRQVGISYATNQIIDLLSNDVDGIHIYTMNNASIAKEIYDNICDVLEAVRQ